jgi:hypothetical protein
MPEWRGDLLAGVGSDAPIITAANGAQQSASRWRFDLVDAPALFVLARILDYGARRYAPNNWRGLSVEDHLNHAAVHLWAYLAGDRRDDHLGHLFCRSMMALGVALATGYDARQSDEGETA